MSGEPPKKKRRQMGAEPNDSDRTAGSSARAAKRAESANDPTHLPQVIYNSFAKLLKFVRKSIFDREPMPTSSQIMLSYSKYSPEVMQD